MEGADGEVESFEDEEADPEDGEDDELDGLKIHRISR
jgi:hypothetical protein